MQTSFNANSGIIPNKLFVGLNGKVEKDDGWQTNHNPNLNKNSQRQNSHQLNANLKYIATDNFDLFLSLFDDKDYKYDFKGGGIPQMANMNSYKRKDFKDVNFETNSYLKIKSKAQSIKMSYNFNQNNSLTSISTNKNMNIDGNWDTDYGNNPSYDGMSMYQDAKTKNFTQELRLSGKNNIFRYVTGIYFEKDSFDFDNYGMEYPSYLVGDPFGVGVDVKFNSISQSDSATYATFGQIMYNLIFKIVQ